MPKNAATLFLALLLPAALAAGDDPEPKARYVKPREIVAAGLPAVGDGSLEPTSITNEKRLAELIPSEKERAAILKQVNFRKERLLLFSWCGGVGDRLTPVEGKAGEAVFEYFQGKTTDCVQQARLFAVPAKAKVRVTR